MAVTHVYWQISYRFILTQLRVQRRPVRKS